MNSKCSKLLVAAIDVGAIDSGYAFLIRHEDLSKITVNSVWAGGNLMSLRCPTCVLFNEKKQFHSFGYEAEYKYSDLVLNNEHGKWYYFRRFKSILDNKQIQTDHCPLYPCSLPQDSRSNITLAKATEVVEGGNQDYELENTSLQYNYLRISYTDFVEKITRWDERIYLRNEHVEIYSKKCFQLCWLMSIQDPPVVLSKDPQRDAHFDTNMYKHYTNSGDNFDYVVWPALLLHKDGPLLTKGVAQPYPRPRAKSAPAVGRSARKDDKSFDGTSDDKLLESTSGSGRMDTTQYGYQTRNDATLFSKSGQNPMVTQTYSANGGKYRGYSPRSITPAYVQSITPAHLQVSELKQLYQPHIFQSKHDIERFQRFCQQVSIINEQDLRRMYGTYYDYYYTLYINQIFGDYRFT